MSNQLANLPSIKDMPVIVPQDTPALAKLRQEYHKGPDAFTAALASIGMKHRGAELALRRGDIGIHYTRAIEINLMGIDPVCPSNLSDYDTIQWHIEHRSQTDVAKALRMGRRSLLSYLHGNIYLSAPAAEYVNNHMRGLQASAPLPIVEWAHVKVEHVQSPADLQAPVIDEDASDDEIFEVFLWHYERRGAAVMARQIGVSNFYLGKIKHKRPEKPNWTMPEWLISYTIEWLSGAGVFAPIPMKNDQDSMRAPKPVEVELPAWMQITTEYIPPCPLPPEGEPKMDARSRMIRRMIKERQQQQRRAG